MYSEESGIECFRMDKAFFETDFKLSLSDSTYQVVRFNIVTSLIDGSLVKLVGGNEGIRIQDNSYTKMLRQMPKKALITVENICVVKNGEYFRVPSFICYTLK